MVEIPSLTSITHAKTVSMVVEPRKFSVKEFLASKKASIPLPEARYDTLPVGSVVYRKVDGVSAALNTSGENSKTKHGIVLHNIYKAPMKSYSVFVGCEKPVFRVIGYLHFNWKRDKINYPHDNLQFLDLDIVWAKTSDAKLQALPTDATKDESLSDDHKELLEVCFDEVDSRETLLPPVGQKEPLLAPVGSEVQNGSESKLSDMDRDKQAKLKMEPSLKAILPRIETTVLNWLKDREPMENFEKSIQFIKGKTNSGERAALMDPKILRTGRAPTKYKKAPKSTVSRALKGSSCKSRGGTTASKVLGTGGTSSTSKNILLAYDIDNAVLKAMSGPKKASSEPKKAISSSNRSPTDAKQTPPTKANDFDGESSSGPLPKSSASRRNTDSSDSSSSDFEEPPRKKAKAK